MLVIREHFMTTTTEIAKKQPRFFVAGWFHGIPPVQMHVRPLGAALSNCLTWPSSGPQGRPTGPQSAFGFRLRDGGPQTIERRALPPPVSSRTPRAACVVSPMALRAWRVKTRQRSAWPRGATGEGGGRGQWTRADEGQGGMWRAAETGRRGRIEGSAIEKERFTRLLRCARGRPSSLSLCAFARRAPVPDGGRGVGARRVHDARI